MSLSRQKESRPSIKLQEINININAPISNQVCLLLDSDLNTKTVRNMNNPMI